MALDPSESRKVIRGDNSSTSRELKRAASRALQVERQSDVEGEVTSRGNPADSRLPSTSECLSTSCRALQSSAEALQTVFRHTPDDGQGSKDMSILAGNGDRSSLSVLLIVPSFLIIRC